MTASRRVLIVEFQPGGGLYQFSFQLGEALSRLGHHVTLLTGPEPELRPTGDDPNGLHVESVFDTWQPAAGAGASRLRRKVRRVGRAARYAQSWVRLLRRVRAEQPDVVQVGELRFEIDLLGVLALRRWCRVATLTYIAHNPTPFRYAGRSASMVSEGRVMRALMKRVYRALDRVYVLSDKVRDDLLLHWPSTPVTVIHHGDYRTVLSGRSAVPDPSCTGRRLLFFGTLTRYKNLDLLLDAFELVRATLPDAELHIAGSPAMDIDLDALRRRAEAIGNVELRAGYVPFDELPALFGSARAIVAPYQMINVSGVVHLAYTFGRPVLATRVGAMDEIVLDGETGFLADGAPLLAERAVQLLTDGVLARDLGRRGMQLLDRHASWDDIATAYAAAW